MTIFYKKNGKIVPKVVRVSCDKLTMTVDVHPSERMTVATWVKQGLCPTPRFGIYERAGLLPTHDASLASGWVQAGDAAVLVQCKPRIGKINKMRYMRVEMNPSRVDLKFALHVMNLNVPGLYEQVVQNGVTTSFDLAVDIAYAEIDDFAFCAPKYSVTRMHQKSGKTYYIGTRHWRIYDKRAEILHANKKKAAAAKVDVPPYPLLRVERMLTLPQVRPPLSEIPSLPNQFENLAIASYAALPDGEDPWRVFLHAARLGGAQAALANIKSRKTKAEYVKRLQAGWTDWWKPDDFWSHLPRLVDSILDPFADATASSQAA